MSDRECNRQAREASMQKTLQNLIPVLVRSVQETGEGEGSRDTGEWVWEQDSVQNRDNRRKL